MELNWYTQLLFLRTDVLYNAQLQYIQSRRILFANQCASVVIVVTARARQVYQKDVVHISGCRLFAQATTVNSSLWGFTGNLQYTQGDFQVVHHFSLVMTSPATVTYGPFHLWRSAYVSAAMLRMGNVHIFRSTHWKRGHIHLFIVNKTTSSGKLTGHSTARHATEWIIRKHRANTVQ